jgi:hypothetical protein
MVLGNAGLLDTKTAGQDGTLPSKIDTQGVRSQKTKIFTD